MSHQPAALFPEWYLPPWQLFEEFEQFDYDLAYHPGETIEPTPSPVQAATVRAAAYGGSLSEAEMVAVLYSAGWPEELHRRALEVSYCESRWSPYAVGDGGRSLGLFQMQWSGAGWRGWFIPAGEDEAMAHDPVVNARTAWWAYQRSGWGPWSCAR
jgi:hypothetical protein